MCVLAHTLWKAAQAQEVKDGPSGELNDRLETQTTVK